MADRQFQSGKVTSGRSAAIRSDLIGKAKAYATTLLIVTILLSVWAGLCAT
jgi:hypothetical protein